MPKTTAFLLAVFCILLPHLVTANKLWQVHTNNHLKGCKNDVKDYRIFYVLNHICEDCFHLFKDYDVFDMCR